MTLTALLDHLHTLAAKPGHVDRVLRAWLQVGSYDRKGTPAATYFPATLRAGLADIEARLAGLAHIQGAFPAALTPSRVAGEGASEARCAESEPDEVARLLVTLADGQQVESVLLPRGGLCISSQVGCAVGCVFCMSGRDGLQRQLSSLEMLAQVVLARQRRAVEKVVFMGMGEPAHNLDNVLAAIHLLGIQGNIGHKNLVLSSVGDRRLFERLLAQDAGDCAAPSSPGVLPAGELTVKPALAISLHSTDDDLRARLLPNAPRIPVAELVELAERYARATHYPTQYQWTLIDGVNDGDDELARLAELLRGKYAVLNFIPFNAVDGLPYRRPAPERIAAMTRWLNQRQIYSRIRDSAGQEIEGACGQLRARAEKKARRSAVPIVQA